MEEKGYVKKQSAGRKGFGAAGAVLTLILAAAVAVLSWTLYSSKLLPTGWLAGIIGGCVAVAAVLAAWVNSAKKKGWFAAGAVCAVAVAAVLLTGNFYIAKGVAFLNNITMLQGEKSLVDVYVASDSKAKTIEDVKNGTFGIMKLLDRDNTDEAVRQINEKLNATIKVKEYDGFLAQIDALRQGKVDAIVLNSAFVVIAREQDGYNDLYDEIRVLSEYTAELEEEETPDEEEKPTNAFTMYFSGVNCESDMMAKVRSDVNILAAINADTRQVALVSMPRNAFVSVPHLDHADDHLANAAIYGMEASMDTLSKLYGTDVDYYFRVNFSGFKDVIDALEGVTVNSDYDFKSSVDGHTYHYTKGENTLNGKEALSFVREKNAYPDGELQRNKQQIEVIRGVMAKLLSTTFLKNYSAVLKSMEECFESSGTYDMVAELVRMELADNREWNIVAYSISGDTALKNIYTLNQHAESTLHDEEALEIAVKLIEDVLAGETVTQPEEIKK